MKIKILLFAITLFSAGNMNAQVQASTQQCTPITIKFLGFADEQGNRLNRSELQHMLYCPKDKKTMDLYKTGNALNWIGAGLVLVGSILVLTVNLQPKDPLYGYSDSQLSQGLWGLRTMGLGLGFQISGLLVKKSAVRRYNGL